jgi:hypothetical protein
MRAAARPEWQHEATRAFDALEEYLGAVLNTRFKIGWGNRLKRHIGRFIPVVRAAGGTLAEAVDHIIATKLLRTIPSRYENDPDDLGKLKAAIERMWRDTRMTEDAVDSATVIDEALRKWGTRVGSSEN